MGPFQTVWLPCLAIAERQADASGIQRVSKNLAIQRSGRKRPLFWAGDGVWDHGHVQLLPSPSLHRAQTATCRQSRTDPHRTPTQKDRHEDNTDTHTHTHTHCHKGGFDMSSLVFQHLLPKRPSQKGTSTFIEGSVCRENCGFQPSLVAPGEHTDCNQKRKPMQQKGRQGCSRCYLGLHSTACSYAEVQLITQNCFQGIWNLLFNNVIAAIPECADGSAGLGEYGAGP